MASKVQLKWLTFSSDNKLKQKHKSYCLLTIVTDCNNVDSSLVDNAIAARDLLILARDLCQGCKQTQQDE